MTFEQLDFVTYCIVNLAGRLSLSQKKVYRMLKDNGIIDYIIKGYDILHTFGKDYLMDDLIEYMREKGVVL